MAKFPVLTDEQMNIARGVVLEGPLEFIVTDDQETVSKAGNPMRKIVLEVRDSNSNTTTVFDYITYKENMMWKLKGLCRAIGQVEMYETGEIQEGFFKNKTGMCIGKRDKETTFMKILNYCTKEEIQALMKNKKPAELKIHEPMPNDDIPFGN